MDTAQWPQEIVVKPIDEIVTNTTTTSCPKQQQQSGSGKLARPQKEAALNCPRCNSTNTKFCYYNNYSLTQPRYFCKTCRRYWTEGGSLRNIPVGGGSRKNKRPSSSSTSSSSLANSSSKKLPDLVTPPSLISSQSTTSTTNPIKIHEGQDLNLAFPQDFRTISELVQVPTSTTTNMDHHHNKNQNHISSSALELLTGITNSRGFSSFMPVQDPYTSGFSLQEFKPSLNFSLDGLGLGSSNNNYGSLNNPAQESTTSGHGGRLLFPFEDLKQVPASTTNVNDHQQNIRDHQGGDISTGYWTGMLGGGSW